MQEEQTIRGAVITIPFNFHTSMKMLLALNSKTIKCIIRILITNNMQLKRKDK